MVHVDVPDRAFRLWASDGTQLQYSAVRLAGNALA